MWGIFFLDQKISQKTGCPYLFRDNEVAVSELKNGYEFHNDINDDPASSIDESKAYMQTLIDMAKLWSRIWDTSCSVPAVSKHIQR